VAVVSRSIPPVGGCVLCALILLCVPVSGMSQGTLTRRPKGDACGPHVVFSRAKVKWRFRRCEIGEWSGRLVRPMIILPQSCRMLLDAALRLCIDINLYKGVQDDRYDLDSRRRRQSGPPVEGREP